MSLTNFVQLRLHAGITAGATSMTVIAPVAPFRLPDGSGTLVLMDSLMQPSKAEIVTYTGLVNNGNGTHSFTGLGRGAEGTTAQPWSAQANVVESVTAGVLASLLSAKLDAGATAAAATKLATARTITMTGDVTWSSGNFDGSGNVAAAATLANSGVAAGTYGKVTVNAKGLVTAGAALEAADIPSLDAAKITSGTLAAARIPTLNQSTTGSAATLTTARTLTIGGTGKAFNGGANVSWTLAEIGAVGQTAATGAAVLPVGTTAQRPAGTTKGWIRYNSTLDTFEGYGATGWAAVGGGDATVATASSAAGTLALAAVTNETVLVTLTEDITSITLPAGEAGKRKDLIIQFTQDGTGGHTVSGWPAGTKFEAGQPPVVSAAPASVTQLAMSNLNNGGWDIYNGQQSASDRLMLRIPVERRLVVGAVAGAALVAQVITSLRVYYIPFTVPRRMRLSAMGVSVSTSSVGSGTLGIYANDGSATYDQPGTLLAATATGAISTASTGTKTAGIDFVLEPGAVYWAGFVNSAAGSLRSVPVAGQSACLGFTDAAMTVTSCLYSANGGNALPAPANPSPLALAATSIPAIYLIEALG